MEALHGINDFDEFDGVTRHVPNNNRVPAQAMKPK